MLQLTRCLSTANVAHLVRAPGCGSGGSGFNPHHSPQVSGRRIMANMSAFQANDESSILSARTKHKHFHLSYFYISYAIDIAFFCFL